MQMKNDVFPTRRNRSIYSFNVYLYIYLVWKYVFIELQNPNKSNNRSYERKFMRYIGVGYKQTLQNSRAIATFCRIFQFQYYRNKLHKIKSDSSEVD